MKIYQRVIFIIVLIVFVGASVWMTFNSVSRDTFEYSEKQNIAGQGFDGWVFDGFNGNSNTKQVRIYYVTDKHGENEDTSKPIVAVDDYTFVSDEYVEYIYIGPTVRYIDEQAFVYCKQLRAIYVDKDNPWYTDADGILYTKDMKTMLLYPICRCTQIVMSDIEKYGEVKNIGLDVKESITANGNDINTIYNDFKNKVSDDISRELFDELYEKGITSPYIGTYYTVKSKSDTSLTVEKSWSYDEKFDIPEGVTRIANNCFYKCDRLVNITIPSSVSSIGNMAFFKCNNIALVTLPEGLTEIGDDAFSYCWSMRYSVFIPKSVEKIGHHCFYKCDGLERFYLESKSENDISLGGNWQPKKENSFQPDDPYFGSSYIEYEEYNAQRKAQEKPAVQQVDSDSTNYTIITVFIIIIFIPSLIIVVLQVIRNLFKADFLMSKKKKLKLQKKAEELEKLRAEYAQKIAAQQDDEGGEE